MRLILAILLFALAAAFTPAQAQRPIAFATEVPRSGALVLPLAGPADLAVRGAALDAAEREAVARALAAAEFRYRRNMALTLRGIGPWTQIVVVGTGAGPLDAARLQDIGGVAARETARENGPLALLAEGLGAADQLAIGAGLGGYRFDRYLSEDPENPRPAGRNAPLTIVTAEAAGAEARWAREGRAQAEAVRFARDLITEPGNVIYPESFVTRTREAFRGVAGVTITVLDVPQMEQLGMGAILSVGRGSVRPPRMLIVEYRGAGAPAGAPIVLAGKGITFDSGGVSIKASSGMWRMKTDMSGAAAVTATVLGLARAQAPVHVIAISGLAENMPDGGAARPGDVVRAHNGRTIEILNTDAEGRMVLADAVSYAERRFQPAVIVDVATLTGAIVGALGPDYAGLFSRNDMLAEQLVAAGRATGEQLWRMPLHPRYAEALRSPIADIRDVAEGGGPGAGLGAHFIGSFVTPATPWAHIDIAGTAWTSTASPTVPAGAAGFPVRLLDRFVRDFRPIPAAPPLRDPLPGETGPQPDTAVEEQVREVE